jgi:branched-chain amino acid transport system ATP-binding protein
MVLLGGVQTPLPPDPRRAAYTALHEQLQRLTDLWRRALRGCVIVALVLFFPQGWRLGERLWEGGGRDRAGGAGTSPKAFGACRPWPRLVRGGGGEMLALIGPNAAGNPPCFQHAGRPLRPDSGRGAPQWQGHHRPAADAGSALGVGAPSSSLATSASIRARRTVHSPSLSHHRRLGGLWRPVARMDAAPARALLERLGMAEQAARPCGILAYGDLKRVELAIALANQPKLLLMDEPTAGMAPQERVSLMALTAQIARESGIAVLFTEHDMDVVFGHADRILVLDRGRLIAEGAPAAVRADPKVREVYLGSGAVTGAH